MTLQSSKLQTTKLLLHACCAPCSIAYIESLRAEGIKPELFWYNPNIHPVSEYELRRDCLKNFTESEQLPLIFIDEQGLDLTGSHPARCEKCYRARLEKTAAFAAQEGFQTFTTTLLISPYQNHDLIKCIGEKCAQKYGVEFLYRDFRPLFREGQAKARAKYFYMQKYCGCALSKDEKNSKPNSPSVLSVPPSNLRFDVSVGSFNRISLLTGEEGLKKLQKTSVLIFGAGGVGSWAAEALVRSGIGKIGIIDNDTVCASNINRQIEATTLTLGQPKASTLKKRLLEINPECEVTAWDELFCRENAANFNIESADYVIDAIDTMNHKLDLIEIVCNTNVKLFSSMGMALKMDPSQIKTASIWKTEVCALAKHVRQGLRKRGFSKDFTVVYSSEPAMEPQYCQPQNESGQRPVNGSIVTVTASAGLMLASLVINDVVHCHE